MKTISLVFAEYILALSVVLTAVTWDKYFYFCCRSKIFKLYQFSKDLLAVLSLIFYHILVTIH
jgi:hypothetical protein